MKLGDISKNISSAFNWTFNDNGNKIDKTRVRLDDFSPIHSTGTTRLRAKWPYALAIVAPLLTNYALDDDFSPAKTIDEKSGYAITATALLRRIDRYFIKKNGMDVGTLCINKDPNKDTPPTSAEHLETTELSLKISQSWLAQNTIASLLFINCSRFSTKNIPL